MCGHLSLIAKNSSPTLMTPTGRPFTSTVRHPSRRTSSTLPTRISMRLTYRDANRFAMHYFDGFVPSPQRLSDRSSHGRAHHRGGRLPAPPPPPPPPPPAPAPGRPARPV